jgi:hypothetical protein
MPDATAEDSATTDGARSAAEGLTGTGPDAVDEQLIDRLAGRAGTVALMDGRSEGELMRRRPVRTPYRVPPSPGFLTARCPRASAQRRRSPSSRRSIANTGRWSKRSWRDHALTGVGL